MAEEFEKILGADNGNPPDSLRQMYPKVNRNFDRVKAWFTSTLSLINGHIQSASAHLSEHITYSGAAPGANVKQGIDNTYNRISEIVAQAGDDNTEVVDARDGYPVLGDRLNAFDEQLADTPLKYGAIGDGVANDSAAFSLLEATVTGEAVDLRGKVYLVNSIPRKNAYYNGTFKVGSNTRPSILAEFSLTSGNPKFHHIGGQLAKLKQSLLNPLEQMTGIVFIGDSITWGSGLGSENSVSTPRDGTLSDPRDNFMSPSYVNTVKRYLGQSYAFNANPTLSNWSASSSGESTAEYSTERILYPKDGDFAVTTSGTSVTVTEAQTADSVTGYQLRLEDGNPAGTSYVSIKFKFTGESFVIAFGSIGSGDLDYDLYVDGVKLGTYSTTAGVDGIVIGSNNRRTHTFGYIRDKEVEIRTNRNGAPTGVRRFRVEGIIINKKIRITNQGIVGSSARIYKNNNLTGNTQGDGVAITAQDNYVFCQLGTNDRGIVASSPKGTNQYKINLKSTVDLITPLANLILMSANPVVNEDPATYSFNMQQVRGVNYDLAKSINVDMIDNYASWSGLDISVLSNDGLHPNALGHLVIANNIIGALESA